MDALRLIHTRTSKTSYTNFKKERKDDRFWPIDRNVRRNKILAMGDVGRRD